MLIIVGLGNPGQEYENTRHNLGFMAVDALAKELNLDWQLSKKFKAQIAKSQNLILVKPQDFMNNSGQSIAAVLNYYFKAPLDKGNEGGSHLSPLIKGPACAGRGWGDFLSDTLTVIHDDLDIEFGKFKVSLDSRSAGHKGVESIINHLKTKNFRRIRIGIKTPALENIPADKFVLQKFKTEELKKIKAVIAAALKEIII